MGDAAARQAENAWLRAMPGAFVLIWSTGFVVARFGMPHAPPLSFLSWRYAFSLIAFGAWIAAARVRWPRPASQWAHLAVTGVLMQGVYLGGIWAAVKLGLPAGMAALVAGLQPVLTAVWVQWTGSHRIGRAQWLGLALGLGGLTLVVWHKLGAGHVTLLNLAPALMALAGMTAGTLYQKHFVQPADARSANFVQLAAALAVTLPLALLEHEPVRWHAEMIGAMAWSVLVLTLGGNSLLLLLIQRGAATQVTSLLYLVPPTTALMAWVLFDEPLTLPTWLGMGACALGVALVQRSGATGVKAIERRA